MHYKSSHNPDNPTVFQIKDICILVLPKNHHFMNQSIQIRHLAKGVFHAMNTRDFDPFEHTITDDLALDFPGVGKTKGRRKTILLLKSILRKYPKLHFTVSETIAESDRVCVVWSNVGEEINGQPYSNSGVNLIYFLNGKINFISDYFKDTSFVKNT